MAELFISAFLQVLVDRLGSSKLLQFARHEGLGKLLKKLEKMLIGIQYVLLDVGEKQFTDMEVKAWLDDLTGLAYDAEDTLDELATEALRCELMAKSQASTSKVRSHITSWLIGLIPSALRIKINGPEFKIKAITDRFTMLLMQKDDMNLKESVSSRSRPIKTRGILPTTSLVAEDHIYGREKVAEAMVQLLVCNKHMDALTNVTVIPIVGMGGIGKTTLAKLVYNDKKVNEFFDLKAWARVSEDFDILAVTKTILLTLNSENCDGEDLDSMQLNLRKKLYGKKFLVILDDVWNENYNDWTLLRAPFEVGAPGSSIIVTTRNLGVSSLMSTIKVTTFQLELLPNDACLAILSLHALDARDFNAYAHLKDIGEEIVRRCRGLPLAVKAIGGLLRHVQDREEWEKVLKNEIWDITAERSGIFPALMLSYHHLPSSLKRCFAYCSILPKDYEFEEKEMVLLWMAEGLIQPLKDQMRMEDLGTEYFHDLLSRSIFLQSSSNKSRFLMHDLIHDLAQSIAGEMCFRMEDKVQDSNHGIKRSNFKKVRHSSYLGSLYDVAKKFEIFLELTSLRTFLPLMLPYPGHCYLSHCVPLKFVPKLRFLRVLSLNGYCITKLSNSISDLKHLRYLDLSKTKIRSLPESITSLYNLQTLLLKECHYLKKLPLNFGSLVNLRHLDIEGADSLEGMPMQIGKLTCLQTLSNQVLGKDNCSGIQELGPLNHLKGTLHISRLENVVEPQNAKDAGLINKTKINVLSLEWSEDIDELKDRTSDLEILDGLQPHYTLKEIVIRNYGSTKFPIWLRASFFPHMVSLTLESCYKCTVLPPFGQLPLLKILLIEGMASVETVGPEFCGYDLLRCFESLETLSFKNMKEWKYWSPCQVFPNLRKLSLIQCPKLLGNLPSNIPLLEKVEIRDCGLSVISISSFPDLCKIIIQECHGVVRGNKVALNSAKFESFQTISELSCRLEGFDAEGLAKLEDLSIERCEEVTHLWSDEVGSLPCLPFLRVLKIMNCEKLRSLVAEEVEELLQLGMPSMLTRLIIENCRALESLPKAMMCTSMTHLEFIHITGCDSLTHFAKSQLPPTLKWLHISDCKNIRILVEDDTNYSCSSTPSLLESLIISRCPSLKHLTSSGLLPASLRYINIAKCPNLESGLNSFDFNLYLESIFISQCEKLQALPNGINNLTSLRSLEIRNCQGIQSFPVEGFPKKLTRLAIIHLKITDALLDWGLDKLTLLEELHIGGCQHLVSFPGNILPVFLKSLHISSFPNLEYLNSMGFQKLGFLKDLIISDCKRLQSISLEGLPCSLVTLDIYSCQKLISFPKNGLPPTLEKLRIKECPQLEERCKKGGSEWSKIENIPYVEVSNKFIYDSETEE